MARRSSVWSDIQRDRELRRRQVGKAERVHLTTQRDLQADTARSWAAEDRQAKALQKERIDAEHQAAIAIATAAVQAERLSARVSELGDMLRAGVAQHPLSVADLQHVQQVPFDPGEDGVGLRTPRRPVMREGGLLGRSRRRRELDEAMSRYAGELADHERLERERSERLAVRAERHERQARSAVDAAAALAKRIENGIADGDRAAVEEYARLAIERLGLPDGVALLPKVAYRPDPRELVVDIRLPEVALIPVEKLVKYVRGDGEHLPCDTGPVAAMRLAQPF